MIRAGTQGRTMEVRVTAAPPSWLRWLLGSGVSTSVSVIDYGAAGQPTRVIRLSRPSATRGTRSRSG